MRPAIIVALLPGSLSWQNTSTYFGPPGTAPSSARSFWLSRRTLSPKRPVSTIAWRQLASSASEMSTWGGCAEIEQQALIVRPQSRSSLRAITMTTPLASARIAALKVSSSTVAAGCGAANAGSAST